MSNRTTRSSDMETKTKNVLITQKTNTKLSIDKIISTSPYGKGTAARISTLFKNTVWYQHRTEYPNRIFSPDISNAFSRY